MDSTTEITAFFQQGGNQINMAWTSLNKYAILFFFFGLLFILISFIVMWNLKVTTSKRNILILGFVGFSFLIVGLYMTLNSFNKVIRKINQNIYNLGDCSLFQNNNVSTALDKIVTDKALPLAASSAIAANTSLYNQNSLRSAAANGSLSGNIFTNRKDDASLSFVNASPPKSSFSSLKNTKLPAPSPTSNLGSLRSTQPQQPSPFNAPFNAFGSVRSSSNDVLVNQIAPSNDAVDQFIRPLVTEALNTGTVPFIDLATLKRVVQSEPSSLIDEKITRYFSVQDQLRTKTDPESQILSKFMDTLITDVIPDLR